MRKTVRILSALLLMALLISGCGGMKFSYDITQIGSKIKIKVHDVDDGETAETGSITAGKGRAVVIESSLEKGQLQIDLMEATIIAYPDSADDEVIPGDIVESVTVGPGDSAQISLEKGDYVFQLTAIGQTDGEVAIDLIKE